MNQFVFEQAPLNRNPGYANRILSEVGQRSESPPWRTKWNGFLKLGKSIAICHYDRGRDQHQDRQIHLISWGT